MANNKSNSKGSIAANTGNDACFILDNFPYTSSRLISHPTNKKKIAIKKSFTNKCKLNSSPIFNSNKI